MIKILIVLDLDGTHFVDLNGVDDNDDANGSWIGGSSLFWTDMYSELTQFATTKGAEALFAVVTKKRFFDNVSEIAAAAFKPFLKISNPQMYSISNGLQYCLVNDKGQLKYECLNYNHSIYPKLTKACSHFEVISPDPSKPKSDPIKRIASFYGIPLQSALLLDDTPAVLDEAKNAGIETLSFQCFNKHELSRIGNSKIKDPAYINENLQRIKKEIFAKVEKMITAALEKKNEEKIETKATDNNTNTQGAPVLQPMNETISGPIKEELFERANNTNEAKENTTHHRNNAHVTEGPARQCMKDTISRPNTPHVNQASFWSKGRPGALIFEATVVAVFRACSKIF